MAQNQVSRNVKKGSIATVASGIAVTVVGMVFPDLDAVSQGAIVAVLTGAILGLYDAVKRIIKR